MAGDMLIFVGQRFLLNICLNFTWLDSEIQNSLSLSYFIPPQKFPLLDQEVWGKEQGPKTTI